MGKESLETPSVEFSLQKDQDGKGLRVWVEQPVIDSSPLLVIQDAVASQLPDLRRLQAKDFHMTLAHFGIPEELFADLKRVKKDLSEEEFRAKFHHLLRVSHQAVTQQTQVELDELAIFGRGENVIVAKTHDTKETRQGREQVTNGIREVIKSLGVPEDDVTDVIRQIPNLYASANFRPHITLGRMPDKLKQLPPLPVNVSGQKVLLGLSRIRNVKIGAS